MDDATKITRFLTQFRDYNDDTQPQLHYETQLQQIANREQEKLEISLDDILKVLLITLNTYCFLSQDMFQCVFPFF